MNLVSNANKSDFNKSVIEANKENEMLKSFIENNGENEKLAKEIELLNEKNIKDWQTLKCRLVFLDMIKENSDDFS